MTDFAPCCQCHGKFENICVGGIFVRLAILLNWLNARTSSDAWNWCAEIVIHAELLTINITDVQGRPSVYSIGAK